METLRLTITTSEWYALCLKFYFIVPFSDNHVCVLVDLLVLKTAPRLWLFYLASTLGDHIKLIQTNLLHWERFSSSP